MKKAIGIIFIILGLAMTISAGGALIENKKVKYELKDDINSTVEYNINSAIHNFNRSEDDYYGALFGVIAGIGFFLTGVILVSSNEKKKIFLVNGGMNVEPHVKEDKTNETNKVNYNTTHMRPKTKTINKAVALTTDEIIDMYLNLKKVKDLDLITVEELKEKKDSIKSQILTKGVNSNVEEFIVNLENNTSEILSKEEIKGIYKDLSNKYENNLLKAKNRNNDIGLKERIDIFENKVSNSKLGNLINKKFSYKKDNRFFKFINDKGQIVTIALILGIIAISLIIGNRPRELSEDMIISNGPYVENISKYTKFKGVSYDVYDVSNGYKKQLNSAYIESIKPGEVIKLAENDNFRIKVRSSMKQDSSSGFKVIRWLCIVIILIIWILRVSLFKNNPSKAAANNVNKLDLAN